MCGFFWENVIPPGWSGFFPGIPTGMAGDSEPGLDGEIRPRAWLGWHGMGT